MPTLSIGFLAIADLRCETKSIMARSCYLLAFFSCLRNHIVIQQCQLLM